MSVHMFTESGEDIFLSMKIVQEQCEGITNPCDLSPKKYARYEIKSIGRNAIWMMYHNQDPNACVHIQHTNMAKHLGSNVCFVYWHNMAATERREVGLIVEVYYDRYHAQRCTSCSCRATMLIYHMEQPMLREEPFNAINEQERFEVSVPKKTVQHRDTSMYFYYFSLLDKRNATSIDGAFHVSISRAPMSCQTRSLDSTYDVRLNYPFTIRKLCATIFYSGNQALTLIIYKVKPSTRITFTVGFENPQICAHEGLVNELMMVTAPNYGFLNFKHVFRWFLRERNLKWTIQTEPYP